MDLIRIGSFLAELRHEKGLTQQALGERLGVTNKTISRWETGCYLPDVEMLSLLSREFGVSINELVAGERLVAEDFKKEKRKSTSLRGIICGFWSPGHRQKRRPRSPTGHRQRR